MLLIVVVDATITGIGRRRGKRVAEETAYALANISGHLVRSPRQQCSSAVERQLSLSGLAELSVGRRNYLHDKVVSEIIHLFSHESGSLHRIDEWGEVVSGEQ